MTKFFKPNAPACDDPILYRGAGLDGIYLCNGFETEEVDGDRYVSIEDIEGLHEAIAFHLVEHKHVFEPKEIRFIRSTMDKTQSEIAEAMGVDEQTVARWEKGKTAMPGPADKMLRVMFLVSTMDPEELREFIEDVIKMDKTKSETENRVTFVRDKEDETWKQDADSVLEDA